MTTTQFNKEVFENKTTMYNSMDYKKYVTSLLEADVEAVKMCLSGYSGAESSIENLYPELPEGVDYFRVQSWMRLINYKERSKKLWAAVSAAYVGGYTHRVRKAAGTARRTRIIRKK